MRLTDWFLVIPFLPLAIVLAAVLDRSLRNIIIVIAITSWPATARFIRAQVLTAKRRLYVDRATRARRRSFARRPPPHPAQRRAADPCQHDAGRADLRSSPRRRWRSSASAIRPAPSWGKMLEEAYSAGAITRHAWWYYLPAGIGIVLVVLAFTLFGRAIEEILDPPLRDAMSGVRASRLHVTYRSERGYVPLCAASTYDRTRRDGRSGRRVGCGKSTIANAVLRLLPPRTNVEGQVLLDGEDVYAMHRNGCAPCAGPRPPSSSRVPCTPSTPCSVSAPRSTR